jgi:hypothetical protein
MFNLTRSNGFFKKEVGLDISGTERFFFQYKVAVHYLITETMQPTANPKNKQTNKQRSNSVQETRITNLGLVEHPRKLDL